jgi:hypothetical protein
MADAPDALYTPASSTPIRTALERLAAKSSRKAELVKLRYFLGCTMAEAAGNAPTLFGTLLTPGRFDQDAAHGLGSRTRIERGQ